MAAASTAVSTPDPTTDTRAARIGAAVFWVAAIIAVPLLMYLGRGGWFHLDDWDYLAQRSARSASDLFEAHNGHWTTLPILQWRALYAVFGLRYEPYQLAVVVSHVAVAVALRQVMIRSGVHVVVTTTLCIVFLLFGAGWQNILVPFQTTFNGSLFFGLVHLLLANRADSSSRRDALGVAAGIVGLMCSGIGLVMMVAVGSAVWIGRGWRPAVWHTGPLAIAYGLWWVTYGRQAEDTVRGSAGDLVSSAIEGITNVFDALTAPGLGLLLLLVTVAGLVWAWWSRAFTRIELASPTALLAAAVALFVAVSFSRVGSRGVDFIAEQGRYVHAASVLVLPAVGVAITVLWSRAWVFGVAALVVVAAAMPANIDDLTGHRRGLDAGSVRALADVEFADELPPESVVFANRLTLGFVLDAVRDDKFAAVEVTGRDRAIAQFVLSLRQVDGPIPTEGCRRLIDPVVITLQPGETVGISNRRIVAREVDAGHDHRLTFRPRLGHELVAVGRPVTVELTSLSAGTPARLCLDRP